MGLQLSLFFKETSWIAYYLGLCKFANLEDIFMAGSSGSQERLDATIRPYHVFLNHRGPDVKHTLASAIYHSLLDSGINVFLDKTEFQAGQELLPTITEAIRTASVHIAILSPRYAESSWCLEELSLMLESRGMILPIFYHVPPGDLLRLQYGKGKYAKAFASKRFRGYDADKLQRWRESLERVSNISGLDLDSDSFNRDESKLVQEIRKRVIEIIRKDRKKAVDGLVGLDEAVGAFECFLSTPRKESDASKIVGIVGTVGSGKTTLAEEFFYREKNSFDRSSLLIGVRKDSGRNGLQALQRQLLKDLTRNALLEIDNVSQGKEILADRVECLGREISLKLLIVIDDVDDQDQLDALLLKDNVLGSNSLVIVTSRDKAVLKLSGISLHYEIKPLGVAHAGELLCGHAFHQPTPIPGFEQFVQTALRSCGGLPLFLKVIGWNLSLYGQHELEMVSVIPEILKAWYGAVGEEEEQTFLDIACFFLGMDKYTALRVCAGLGWRAARALKKLHYMCLVQFDDNNCLKMEDFIFKLAHEIADQQLCDSPHLPCRLWRPNEAISFVHGLLLVPEYTKLKGITETTRNYNKQLRTYTFSSLKIELLDVDGHLGYSDIFGDLVWFRWRNCPQATMPPYNMNNLHVLELLGGNLENLWGPNFEPPEELREIRVINCTQLTAIPPTILLLQRLEKMTLDSIPSLVTLPRELCELRALKYLVIKQCEGLTSLPDMFGHLTNLQYIDFSYCQSLQELPRSFRHLIHLKYLDVQKCKNLSVEGDAFESIRNLEELNFECCTMLQQLPNETTSQESLRMLNLMGTGLKTLPHDIEKLTKLEHLIVGSPFLTGLPVTVENMHCLSEIKLSMFVQNSYTPPSTIGHLSVSATSEMPTQEDTTDVTAIYVYRPKI